VLWGLYDEMESNKKLNWSNSSSGVNSVISRPLSLMKEVSYLMAALKPRKIHRVASVCLT